MVVLGHVQDPEDWTVIGFLDEGVKLLVGRMNRDVILRERVVEYVGWVCGEVADDVDRRTLFHRVGIGTLDPDERCDCNAYGKT